jgi:manganese/zinc/iron transport system ATP- binding protein
MLQRPVSEATAESPNGRKPPERPALELAHVSAGYGRRLAISDVTVTVLPGKRVGLIGPNGAGKSTLLRAIVGLLPLMNGQVLINGRADHRSRRDAAYVPQFEDVDWDFPVAVIDVVVMGMARQVGWLRLPGRRHFDLAREALRRVGMADYERRQIGELSGGQKRRVFIARALAQGANVLLLDEPFSGVDALGQRKLFDILDELRMDGVTVVLATHDLSQVPTRFDELLILNQHLIAHGKPGDVFKPEILAEAFGGQLAIWEGDKPIIMLADQH